MGRLLIYIAFSTVLPACVSLNTTMLQDAQVLQKSSEASIGIIGGGVESTQLPFASFQLRVPAFNNTESQLEWLLPGWPTFSIKYGFEFYPSIKSAGIFGFQYSQVERGVFASGTTDREHRLDLSTSMPISWHNLGWIAPYGGPQILLQSSYRQSASLKVIPSTSLGCTVGKNGGFRLEAGSWYEQKLNWQIRISSFF